MIFSDKEPPMSKKKPPPAVVLQSIFVRDHQRRLRLVIELLEEARRQYTPSTNLRSQSETETLRAFTATPHSSGGKS
jgi:hypothetical protein